MMRMMMDIVKLIGGPTRMRNVFGVAFLLMTFAAVSSAQSILPGNFLPNPDMETETRFVAHRTEGPTDNSFADYWHHSTFAGWNDLTPPAAWPPAPFDLGGTVTTEPVLSGTHSLRLFDQESYYFSPASPGAGLFAQEEVRTFATEIPLDPNSPTGRAEKLWFRWHWNYDMASGFDPSVTMNIRISDAPVVSLDLVGGIIENKTIRTGSSNGLWEEVTVAIDIFPGDEFAPAEQSFDMIILTEGTKDAIGLMWIDDVSVSAIDPAFDADFDGDNDIDGVDFLIWQRGLGLVGQIDNSNGDATGDGIVNDSDLTVWEGQYGGPAPLPLSAAAAAVPEPTAWVLMLVGMGLGGELQRGRRWSQR